MAREPSSRRSAPSRSSPSAALLARPTTVAPHEPERCGWKGTNRDRRDGAPALHPVPDHRIHRTVRPTTNPTLGPRSRSLTDSPALAIGGATRLGVRRRSHEPPAGPLHPVAKSSRRSVGPAAEAMRDIRARRLRPTTRRDPCGAGPPGSRAGARVRKRSRNRGVLARRRFVRLESTLALPHGCRSPVLWCASPWARRARMPPVGGSGPSLAAGTLAVKTSVSRHCPGDTPLQSMVLAYTGSVAAPQAC